MPNNPQTFYFGGSRTVQPQTAEHATIAAVTHAAIESGCQINVGCAIGADALVIRCFRPSSFSLLRIFAAFDPSGAGGWSGSAVRLVQRAAQVGASVAWLAGGALSVPIVARLMARSVAGLKGASAAVFFFPGHGSLKVARQAIRQNIPVFVFGAQPAPMQGGAFVPAQFLGLSCWQFQPSAVQSSLF